MVNLSPEIVPTRYDRSNGRDASSITAVEYDGWSLDMEACRKAPDVRVVDDDMVRYATPMGDFYFLDGHAHADRTLYDTVRLPVLREMVLNQLSEMADSGCVENFTPTDSRQVTDIGN